MSEAQEEAGTPTTWDVAFREGYRAGLRAAWEMVAQAEREARPPGTAKKILAPHDAALGGEDG